MNAPFKAHRVLGNEATKVRSLTIRQDRLTASTAFRGRMSFENQIREGDVLCETGETVTAVFDSIWNPDTAATVDLPRDADGSGVMVALEGGQVHGLRWLSGNVDVFRPVIG